MLNSPFLLQASEIRRVLSKLPYSEFVVFPGFQLSGIKLFLLSVVSFRTFGLCKGVAYQGNAAPVSFLLSYQCSPLGLTGVPRYSAVAWGRTALC